MNWRVALERNGESTFPIYTAIMKLTGWAN